MKECENCGKVYFRKNRYSFKQFEKSLFCSRSCKMGFQSKTHGESETRFYSIHTSILQRCKNISDKNYGGRGIKCLWESFEEFRDGMYESYKSHIQQFGEKDTSIERIDNNGNYCKENCRWATKLEQNNNTRRNVFITFNEKTYTLAQWERILCLKPGTLWRRIHRDKMTAEGALSKPIRNKK